MPGVGIQIPPNLADWWPRLVAAGATDLGGLSANGDHISPEHPFPSPNQVRKRLARDGYALTERLCVYPQFIDQEWIAQGVLDVIKARFWSFIPRRGSGRIDGPKGALRPDTIARARAGDALERRRGDGAVRRDPGRGRSRTCARPPTSCAPSWPGTPSRSSSTATSTCRTCASSAARSAASARAGARRTPTSTTRRSSARASATRSPTARPRSACSRASTPSGRSRTTSGWLRIVKDEAPDIHLHAYSPMEIDAHGAATSRWTRCSRGSPPPGSARCPAPPPRCSTTACASGSARTSCRPPAGCRSSRPRTRPACAPRSP